MRKQTCAIGLPSFLNNQSADYLTVPRIDRVIDHIGNALIAVHGELEGGAVGTLAVGGEGSGDVTEVIVAIVAGPGVTNLSPEKSQHLLFELYGQLGLEEGFFDCLVRN